jgi:hypothetical protein
VYGRAYVELIGGPPGSWPPLEEGLEALSRTTLDFFLKGIRAMSLLASRAQETRATTAWREEHGIGPEPKIRMLTAYFQELERRGEITAGNAAARATAFQVGLYGYANLVRFLPADVPGLIPDPESFRRQFLHDFVRGLRAR